jgi:3-phenylpropionate/trans-cinnamate dioxygenase ferredoxin subunit
MSGQSWVRVADESAFESNPLRTFDVEGEAIIVCKIAGRYYAVEDRCSHDDGRLGQGALSGKELTCPRHGARFDATSGAALSMPAVAPIRTFATKVEDAAVWIAIEI